MAAVERITAPLVQRALDDHLQRHELKLDPKLHNVHEAVFGVNNQGGLCDKAEALAIKFTAIDKNLESINDTLKWLMRLVIGAVILALLGVVLIKQSGG